MALRYGRDKYSQHRYSWLTEWVPRECQGDVPVVVPPVLQINPLGMIGPAPIKAVPVIGHAGSRWRQQRLG